MASNDDADAIYFNRNWCKPFSGAGELADYLAERATAWKVSVKADEDSALCWSIVSDPERPEIPQCPAVLGPSRTACALLEGHPQPHEWATGSSTGRKP
jgi:hypothetical protein